MRGNEAINALRAWVSVCALSLLTACSQREGRLTEVVVTIDADKDVAANLTTIEIATYDADAVDSNPQVEPITSGKLTLHASKPAPGTAAFPFSVGVSKNKADRFLLVVTGYAGQKAVIEQKARLAFVNEEVRGVGIYLGSPCYKELCGGVDSSDWLTRTCRGGEDGMAMCGAVEVRETVRVIIGKELEAGLTSAEGFAETDDGGSDAALDADDDDGLDSTTQAATDAGHNASDSAPQPDAASAPTDYALGAVGGSCATNQNQTLACEGHASRKVLICNHGTWDLFQTCPENARCDSRVGAGQGLCLSIPAACVSKAAGDVCDAKIKRVCGLDLISLADSACPENAHCDDSAGAASCACDTGYDALGTAVCANHNDCPTGACVGGSCADAVENWSCMCNAGFAGTGTKMCTPVRYCPKDACTPGGTCVDVPNWYCHCGAGYAGEGTQACTSVNDCPANRCTAPNGTCQDGINTYTCQCNPGYSGPDCATDACAPNPCQHGGVCSRTPQGASCGSCGSGYIGMRCETDINECATTNLCASADYPCVQTAPPGYTCQGQFADWHMPDAVAGSKFAPSYDTSTPGIVVDRVTGLMWQATLPAKYTGCTGQYHSDSGQVGDACTWSAAKNYCSGLTLAGQSDWRLPTKIELESIVDETKYGPAIDPGAFPGTPAEVFWTASPFVGSSGNAWYLNFGDGTSSNYGTSTADHVRCVR